MPDLLSIPVNLRPPPRQIIRPLLQLLHASTPAPPISSRKQRVKKSQKGRPPRTTGFNKESGEGLLINACGTRMPETKEPVADGSGKGEYRCPRCLGRLTRPRSVKDHFVSCVRKYGNPQGFHWFDHQTLAATKKWLLDRVPRAREEENIDDLASPHNQKVTWISDNTIDRAMKGPVTASQVFKSIQPQSIRRLDHPHPPQQN